MRKHQQNPSGVKQPSQNTNPLLDPRLMSEQQAEPAVMQSGQAGNAPGMANLSAEKQHILSLYRIVDGRPQIEFRLRYNRLLRIKLWIQEMPSHMWFFAAMLNMELIMLALFSIYYAVDDQDSRRLLTSACLMYCGLSFSAWAFYLCYMQRMIEPAYAWSWFEFASCMLLVGLGGLAKLEPLSALAMAVCFVAAYMRCGDSNQCCNPYVKGLIISVLFLGEALLWPLLGVMATMLVIGKDINQTNINAIAIILLSLVGVGVVYIVVDVGIKTGWTVRTKLMKWEIFCLAYALVFCLAVTLSITYLHEHWLVVTQAINAMFLLCLAYYLLEILQVRTWKIFTRRRQGSPSNPSTTTLYQISDTLLCADPSAKSNPRQSVLGKPLADCVVCLSEQSMFCYENCCHACIGYECAGEWLKQGIRNCPICREMSMRMLGLQRRGDLELEVVHRYGFVVQV